MQNIRGPFGIQFPLLVDMNETVSTLYDVAGANTSSRAYFIVDPDQVIRMVMIMTMMMALMKVSVMRLMILLKTVLMTILVMMLMTIEQVIRARVVGDLPVALGIDEMVRQVRNVMCCLPCTALQVAALQLAITAVYVDINHPEELPREEGKHDRQGIRDTNTGFYNRKILKVSQFIIIVMTICPVEASSQPQSPDQQQSPIDLGPGEPDPSLGPISFLYTPVWQADPEPWPAGGRGAREPSLTP